MSEDRIADIMIVSGYFIIIFLRICNVINWSWVWILCPFWLPVVLALSGLIIGLMIELSIYIIKKFKEKENERN